MIPATQQNLAVGLIDGLRGSSLAGYRDISRETFIASVLLALGLLPVQIASGGVARSPSSAAPGLRRGCNVGPVALPDAVRGDRIRPLDPGLCSGPAGGGSHDPLAGGAVRDLFSSRTSRNHLASAAAARVRTPRRLPPCHVGSDRRVRGRLPGDLSSTPLPRTTQALPRLRSVQGCSSAPT